MLCIEEIAIKQTNKRLACMNQENIQTNNNHRSTNKQGISMHMNKENYSNQANRITIIKQIIRDKHATSKQNNPQTKPQSSRKQQATINKVWKS